MQHCTGRDCIPRLFFVRNKPRSPKNVLTPACGKRSVTPVVVGAYPEKAVKRHCRFARQG